MSVSNASEIAEEALGSSDGSRDQRFYLANVPVLDATILVDEGSGFEAWTETDDFSDSGPDDRHYVLNRGTGEVLFGDGRHGKVPVAGANNVTVSPYRYGGGTRGNVGAGTITQLRSSHVYVDIDIVEREKPAHTKVIHYGWVAKFWQVGERSTVGIDAKV
ncbi:MAG: hypothetical protein ACYTKD_30770, partial [Planctomycetota bacterium]